MFSGKIWIPACAGMTKKGILQKLLYPPFSNL